MLHWERKIEQGNIQQTERSGKWNRIRARGEDSRKTPYYALVNCLRGLMDTFNAVYPQLQDFDFREDALTFELPVYIILGRHDMNATYWIAEEYFNGLQAPQKQLYIFEDSGHGMIWQETDRFHDIMINTVLPETYQP